MEERKVADTKPDDEDKKPAAKSKAGDESSPDSQQPAKKKRKSPVKPWKKPKGMPKRPLSAYNIFFKEERSRLISAGPETREAAPDDAARKTKEDVSIPESSKKKHVGGPGIGFARLAKTIAAKWKDLDEKGRAPYEERAAVEKEQYAKAVAIWRAEQKKKETEAESVTTRKKKAKIQQSHASTNKEAVGPPSPLTPDRSLGGFSDPYPPDWFETTPQQSIHTTERLPHRSLEPSPQHSRLQIDPSLQHLSPELQQSRFETEAMLQRSIYDAETQQIPSQDALASVGSSGGTLGSSELARSLYPPAMQHFPALPLPQAPVPQAARSFHNIFLDPSEISSSRITDSLFIPGGTSAHGAGMGDMHQPRNVALPTLQPRASSQSITAVAPVSLHQNPLLTQSQVANIRRQAMDTHLQTEVGYVRPMEEIAAAIQHQQYQQQRQLQHLQSLQHPQQAQQPQIPQQQQRPSESGGQEGKTAAGDETSSAGPSLQTLRENLDEDTIDFLTNLQFK